MARRGVSQAFTLIELLIVVAIIAILAAIAVPNFLEAQVRSKVSRCRADMRSLTTALEAYATDNNHYPTYHYTSYTQNARAVTHFFLGGIVVGGSTPAGSFDGNPQVTTPIAYITSVPQDPFFVPEGDTPFEAYQFLYVNWNYYQIGTSAPDSTMAWIVGQYGRWRLSSGGPDKSRGDTTVVPGDAWNVIYDPTNGTISPGQIHRTELSPEGIPRPV